MDAATGPNRMLRQTPLSMIGGCFVSMVQRLDDGCRPRLPSSALVCQRRRLFAFGMRAGGVIPSSWQPYAAHGVSCRWPQGMGDVVRRLERLSIGNKGGRQRECQRRLAARGEANRGSHGSRGPRDGTDGFGARHACRLAHPRTEGSCVRQGASDRHWPPTGWCHQRAQSSAQRPAGVL